jgi:hypothetical protein
VKAGWAASFQTMGTLTCNITSEPEQICQGESAMLLANASGGTGTYNCSWSPATSLSNPNIPNPIATPDVTTIYTVTIDDGETIVTDSYTLVVNSVPQVDLGEDQIVCADQTVILDATTPDAISYLWTPGGYTTPTIQVDSTGVGLGSITYSVVVTNANNCEGEDSVIITFDPCIGISEIGDNLSLTIYPNPARNVLNITLNGISESVEYTLLNYQGQHVYNREIGRLDGPVSHQVELGDFAPGIYYLRLNTSEEVIIRKIVIQ